MYAVVVVLTNELAGSFGLQQSSHFNLWEGCYVCTSYPKAKTLLYLLIKRYTANSALLAYSTKIASLVVLPLV
jgi:hypothetical protein